MQIPPPSFACSTCRASTPRWPSCGTAGRTLPELAKIAARSSGPTASRTQQLDVRTALDDIAGDQRRLENEVDTVRTRAEPRQRSG